MTPLPNDTIWQSLVESGICNSRDNLRLRPASANPNRTDFQTRRSYRVHDGDRTICTLVVGHDLSVLWQQASEFSTACPEIACKPLVRRKYQEIEFAAFEFFEGQNLEVLVSSRQLTSGDAVKHAEAIWHALEKTRRPSSQVCAEQELDHFFKTVLEAPIFAGLDQIFLEELVFPLIRNALIQAPLATRWTNGDFIPRNILVDSAGKTRLIDYEFATCTHFSNDDVWRWHTFNRLPNEAHFLSAELASIIKTPGAEAYSLLRQLLLAHRINGALAAIPDSQPALARLQEILLDAHHGYRNSIFLSSLGLHKTLLYEHAQLKDDRTRLNDAKTTLMEQLRQRESNIDDLSRENARLARRQNLLETRLAHLEYTPAAKIIQMFTALLQRAMLSKPPKFHLHFDAPTDWSPSSHRVRVIGWCFPKKPLELREVRVQIDTRFYSTLHGLERTDVGQAHHQYAQAYHSGFELEIDIHPEDKIFTIAVSDVFGRWHMVRSFSLSNPPDAPRGTYANWIKNYDTFTEDRLVKIQAATATLPRQPLVSIILPVYNTPETLLSKAIGSVQAQTYPHWELCIANDASSAPHIRPLLERFAKIDNRIKVTHRETNGHIAAASNTALTLATGEFVALLDHDDELAPHALAEVIKAINQNPDLLLAYSDEDKIDENGTRHAPYFKPDWMPDLFIGHNYLCHFCVCRTDTIRSLGGWHMGFDGAQDWDLQLRIVERASAKQIVHIPHVLYHWRAVQGSTALATGEKNYVVDAARRAITEHFRRTNQKPELIHLPGNHWRAKYPITSPAPLVSLIIPTRDGFEILRRCVDSILKKTTYPRYEIIIVDNGSSDQATLEYLKSVTEPDRSKNHGTTVRVLAYPHPFNYSAINNFGVRAAKGELIGLLNNDIEIITPDWLEELVSHATRPQVGCVGPMLLFPNDTIQHAGVVLGIAGHAGHAFKGFPSNHSGYMNHARLVKNYSAVTGACLMVRKSIYEQVGGLDEKQLGVSLNDVDFCLKVRAAGYRNLWTPFAELYHHESATRGYEDTPEKKARFARERETLRKRWLPVLLHDPAYNPNLTADSEDFALAYPPRHDIQS